MNGFQILLAGMSFQIMVMELGTLCPLLIRKTISGSHNWSVIGILQTNFFDALQNSKFYSRGSKNINLTQIKTPSLPCV